MDQTNTTPEDRRIAALKLAVQAAELPEDPTVTVARAAAFEAFLKGS